MSEDTPNEIIIECATDDILFRIGKTIELNGKQLHCWGETSNHWLFSDEPGVQKMDVSLKKSQIEAIILYHMCPKCLVTSMEPKDGHPRLFMTCNRCGLTMTDDEAMEFVPDTIEIPATVIDVDSCAKIIDNIDIPHDELVKLSCVVSNGIMQAGKEMADKIINAGILKIIQTDGTISEHVVNKDGETFTLDLRNTEG